MFLGVAGFFSLCSTLEADIFSFTGHLESQARKISEIQCPGKVIVLYSQGVLMSDWHGKL